MQTSNNSINRDSLQDAFIQRIIDGMDHKDMYQFVYDNLNDNFDSYSVNELITEVEDYYPELLEQDNDWSLKLTINSQTFLLQTNANWNNDEWIYYQSFHFQRTIRGADWATDW